jgi:hypothetical protein
LRSVPVAAEVSAMSDRLFVNFAEILNIMRVGARRASGFMALGLTAAGKAEPASFNLGNNFSYRFLPDPIDDQLLAVLRKEFSRWVVLNGLRELEQHFAEFLNRLYDALLIADRREQSDPIQVRLKRHLQDTNIAGKLDRLHREYDISCAARDHLASIATARNVLAHNLGTVDTRHCADGNELVVTWWGLDLVIGGQVFSGPIIPPVLVGEDRSVRSQRSDRRCAFAVNTEIELSAHDLSEICWMFLREAEALQNAVIANLDANGARRVPLPPSIDTGDPG